MFACHLALGCMDDGVPSSRVEAGIRARRLSHYPGEQIEGLPKGGSSDFGEHELEFQSEESQVTLGIPLWVTDGRLCHKLRFCASGQGLGNSELSFGNADGT